MLHNERRHAQDKKLALFNAASTAEQEMEAWIVQHPSITLSQLQEAPAGRTLLEKLTTAYVAVNDERLRVEAIDSAEEELSALRGEIRKHLAAQTKEPTAVDVVRKRLARLREQTAEKNEGRHKAAENAAEKNVHVRVQRMLSKS